MTGFEAFVGVTLLLLVLLVLIALSKLSSIRDDTMMTQLIVIRLENDHYNWTREHIARELELDGHTAAALKVRTIKRSRRLGR